MNRWLGVDPLIGPSSKTFELEFRRSWRRKLRQIREPQRLFNPADLFLRFLESVFAKHLVLNVFKLIGNLIELLVREILFPCGKHNRVLPRSMVLVHQHKRFEHLRQGFSVSGRNLSAIGDRKNVIRDLAPAIVLLG